MAGSRIGCLLVENLPWAAWQRAEPELSAMPVVITSGEGSRAQVLACNEEARRAGVIPDMTVACARSLAPNLLVRPYSPALVRSALEAVISVARSFSPRVMSCQSGETFLDVGGLRGFFSTEQQLATALCSKASLMGLEVLVGVGSNLTVASLAARCAGGVKVVAAGEERAFLAPLPTQCLDASPDLRAALHRFGIERLEQLTQLPSQGLGRRLGPEGLRLWRLAHGEDPRVLVPSRLPERFVEEADTACPIDQIEPLLFLLHRALERLLSRLEMRGWTSCRLFLSLGLEPKGSDERCLNSAASCRLASTWGALLRLSLQEAPPRAPVVSLRLELETETLRREQTDLFAPAGPAPAQLDEAVARLSALAGEDRVGAPCLVNSHRLDEFRLVSFEPRSSPIERGFAGMLSPPLRVLRPPEAIEVSLQRSRPAYLHGTWIRGRVLRAAGPWRLDRGWWVDPWIRDYYEVELSNGGLYRIYLNGEPAKVRRWFVDGVCG